MNLYKLRAESLKKLLELNAPPEIILIACNNLARTITSGSYYRLAWRIFKDKLYFDFITRRAYIRFRFYKLFMEHNKALAKVYGEYEN